MNPMTLARGVVVVAIVACTVVRSDPASAQSLSITQVMTPAEMTATGIDKLTPTQRAALDRWLNNYTMEVARIVGRNNGGGQSGSLAGAYVGVGSGHWIRKVSDGGRIVELEDGSIWEINAIDRIYTTLWLPVTDITVLVARTPIGDYRYTLINRDDDETALAKYLGK